MKTNNQISQIISLLLILMTLSACQLGRYVIYNKADINDYKKFPSRSIEKSNESFKFYTATTPRVPGKLSNGKRSVTFEELLEENKTVAFLIIRNDTIQYEKYFSDYEQTSIVPSFSIAKAVTSILIGCAIEDGLINSVDDPISKYLPEINTRDIGSISIKQLLQMTSGIKFNESYGNPFGHAASIYYGKNLERFVLGLSLENEPGQVYNYISGNTQLLGLVLNKVLKGEITISKYLEQKIWKPLGMEYDASWSIDKKKNGIEKTFCCINARAIDLAKIGRLYLNNGKWEGKQLIPSNWVMESTKVDTSDASPVFYQYQWWLPSESGDFLAEGILGQFIYVNPSKNLVIVRLGKKSGEMDWRDMFSALSSYY